MSGLAVLFVLIFLSCSHHRRIHHPPPPVSRKFHQIINISIQIHQPTSPPTDLLPTTYRQTDPPPTNHKPRLHSLSSLRPKSSPESHDPGPRPRPGAHYQPQSRETRGSRHPRRLHQAPDIFVQSRISGLGSILFYELRTRLGLGLDAGLTPRRAKNLGKRSTIYSGPGLMTRLLEFQLAHLGHPRVKRGREPSVCSVPRLRL